MAERPARSPAVYSIPAHRSFADSLVAGLIARYGGEPLGLAQGRILLPNNRAVRTVTEAFVRASGSGLVMPRLIPIGDPEIEERIGGALDPADDGEPVPPAMESLPRLLALASLARGPADSSSEAFRLASDLARTLDALLIEQVRPNRLRDAAADAGELARHWQVSLERLRAIIDLWPQELGRLGRLDLAERRNRLLHQLAARWRNTPPAGFTIAAGITTAAHAVAALLRTIAFMPGGMVILPGLGLPDSLPDEEWDALVSAETGRRDETHPQYHLRLLLDRMGLRRDDVERWRAGGRAASPAVRGRAVANAMASARFSGKWHDLKPAERRLTGVRLAELPDPAAEAQAIALALREVIETPGRTAALVTPDRGLAARVSALLERWEIQADDSAGRPLSQMPAGTLLLAIASAAAERLAPVPLLALLKHPLVGGAENERLSWLDSVRQLDLALRGPRPAPGVEGLDRQFSGSREWRRIRPAVASLGKFFEGAASLASLARALASAAEELAGPRAWTGPDGRMAAQLLGELGASDQSEATAVTADDAVPLLRQLLDRQQVRPPYGGHPRIFIWGLLEARLQQADLMILGGLNEGVWPPLPSADAWLAPKIRSNLGLPGLDYRIGLAAHDFASALGAPHVLITRARRDSRSPTVASRFLLRLQAMTGGLVRDARLERLVLALDDPGKPQPADRPEPAPPAEARPKRISVTAVDRLKADPYSFYAQQILGLRSLDEVDSDHTPAWRGTSVHQVLEQWLNEDDCDPGLLLGRARTMLADSAIHPMLRALWQPRLMEAIHWIADLERDNRSAGRRPLTAEAYGEATVAGVELYGKADRIDRLGGGELVIIDYKTGQPPRPKAVDAGFGLQLGLLGLIARAGGFAGVPGEPVAHEYWSLVKDRGGFGKLVKPDKGDAKAFLAHTEANFRAAAEAWLLGVEPFRAKLHPAFAPYGDYDQLMRLEEWYGRQ